MPTKIIGNDTGNLTEGLRGRLADPLWLLHRQYSLLEFRGEDAASPVMASLSVETRQLPDLPLEAVIEAEPVTETLRFRVAAEGSRALVKWLQAQGTPAMDAALSDFRVNEPLVVPTVLPPEDKERARLWARGGIDVFQILNRPNLDPAIDGQIRAWLADRFVANPQSNWTPDQQAYAGLVEEPGSGIRLTCRGYPGGRLDWTAWSLETSAGASTSVSNTTVPARVQLPGMPDHRWWTIEDSGIDLADPEVEGWRMPQTVAAEFAVAYGDDWFILPVRVQRGIVAKVTSLSVVDSFGITIAIPSSATADIGRPSTFGLWEVTGDPDWLIVAPPMSDALQGPVLERVRFFEDEDANLAWAAEEIVPTPCGGFRENRTVPAAESAELGWVWELFQRIPGHWWPLVPVPRPGTVQIDLVRGRQSNQSGAPEGRVLAELTSIPEEQLRGPAFVVERRWQRSRLADGRAVTWLGRERRVATPAEGRDVAWDRVTRRSEG